MPTTADLMAKRTDNPPAPKVRVHISLSAEMAAYLEAAWRDHRPYVNGPSAFVEALLREHQAKARKKP